MLMKADIVMAPDSGAGRVNKVSLTLASSVGNNFLTYVDY